MSIDALLMGIAGLAKEQGVNANFPNSDQARARMKDCGESIVAAQEELSRRFSTMQARITSLEAEVASLKSKG